jgi:hypothetical protein
VRLDHASAQFQLGNVLDERRRTQTERLVLDDELVTLHEIAPRQSRPHRTVQCDYVRTVLVPSVVLGTQILIPLHRFQTEQRLDVPLQVVGVSASKFQPSFKEISHLLDFLQVDPASHRTRRSVAWNLVVSEVDREEVAEGQGVVLDAEASHGGGQFRPEPPQSVLRFCQTCFLEEFGGDWSHRRLALLEGAVVEVVEEEPDVGYRNLEL